MILAKSGISTVPHSFITGNIGVSPIAATAMTGFSLTDDSGGQFSTSSQVVGKAYGASYVAPTPALLTIAVLDMEVAYTAAANLIRMDAAKLNINGGILGRDFGGINAKLTPGIYTFVSAVTIVSDIDYGGPDASREHQGDIVERRTCEEHHMAGLG
jgi:hypothetical protein